MYTIRRVNANTYDIFTGTQWGTHSRVKATRNGTHVVDGEPLKYGFLKHLHRILDPRMPINYGQDHQQTINNCFNHIK